MSATLVLRNRQRVRPVAVAVLRRIVRHLLQDTFGLHTYELCIHLVGATEMTHLNEHFLRHRGSTDVITFPLAPPDAPALAGEIFICLDDTLAAARRYRVAWPVELTRYVVHGILHLRGHDDTSPACRRVMKREENRLVRQLSRRFQLAALEPA